MEQKFKGKKVLITGGLGFIGSNLAHYCVELGADVNVYDCLEPRSGGNLYNIQSIEKDITLSFQNIENFTELSKAVIGQDFIFNCAASTSHSSSMTEPWKDLDVNGKSVINLLEAIRRFNPSARLVHLGTSTQVGKLIYQPADEKHPEFPRDIYSANKSVSEKYILLYANAHNLRSSVVRFANIYGPRAGIHTPDLTFNNFFVGLALQNKPITVFGEGTQKRNIMFVQDAVISLVEVALSEETIGETYFAVSDEHLSLAETAERTVKYIGKGNVIFVPWPEGKEKVDVGDAIISNEKLKKKISWSPTYSFEKGMLITKNYFENCLNKYLR
jgi:UDP-glucose 4-epimerase